MNNSAEIHPIVFISYAWDKDMPEHEAWVKKLTDDLRSYGVDVILDQYDLPVGATLTSFMERSIEEADKVILILTPKYKEKALSDYGGVKYEYSIISERYYSIHNGGRKFIPVLRIGDQNSSAPGYLKNVVYHSMRDDEIYHLSLKKLLRLIYEEPAAVKPSLGSKPDFNNYEIPDPILERTRKLGESQRLRDEKIRILNSNEGLKLSRSSMWELAEIIKNKAKKYNSNSDFIFVVKEDESYNRKSIIIGLHNNSIRLDWTYSFQNTTEDSFLQVTYFENGIAVFSSERAFFFPGDEPIVVGSRDKYQFDFNDKLEGVWTKVDNFNSLHYTNEKFSSHLFSQLMTSLEGGLS